MNKETRVISDDSEVKTDQEFEITLSGEDTIIKINGKECNLNNYKQSMISEKNNKNKAKNNQFPANRIVEDYDEFDDDNKVEIR